MANQYTPSGERAVFNLFTRLVDKTEEPASDNGCWLWKGRIKKRYPSFHLRVFGRMREIKPHRAILVLIELEGENELFMDLYESYSASELEADHLCKDNPLCINPDHLQWMTKAENIAKRWSRLHADEP